MTKLIDKIKKKLFLLIGRGILAAVESASEKTMKIQVKGLANETISDVERMQEYGLESNPEAGEVIILAPGGNREQAICIKVHDREGRPKTLSPKDVWLWSKHGVNVKLTVLGVDLNSGDAAGWLPNVLPIDPVTGVPHGGPGAGITRLRGS